MSLSVCFLLAARKIAEADALLITAGAGMGVDSGLPDFRGSTGFWQAYPLIAKLGLSFQDMANPAWFEKDPNLAWAFYGHRLNLYRATTPHNGFAQLLKLATAKRGGYFVFTSNVDGQFQKAGFDPGRIVECHGSIHHFQCLKPCSRSIWDARRETINVNESSFRASNPLPRCPFCHGLARPNILMFGDGHWLGERSYEQQIRFDLWLDRLKQAAAKLVVIELGAGTAIPTVRYASESALDHDNNALIRINPRESSVPSGQIGIAVGAAEGIQKIYERVDSFR